MGLLHAKIEQMKTEIVEDMGSGRVPHSVRSFSELHDFVDANCYGGFCDDKHCDSLIERFGGRDEHEGMPQGLLDLIDAAQDAVDQWLKAR